MSDTVVAAHTQTRLVSRFCAGNGSRGLRTVGLLAALIAAPACTDDPTPAPPGPEPPPATAPPGSIVFRLSVPDTPAMQSGVFLQVEGDSPWLTLFDTGGNPVSSTCSLCLCGACNDCSVCGLGTLAPPIVAQVDRAQHFDWTWEGKLYPPIAKGCGLGWACQTQEPAPPGHYTAHFCYARSSDGVGPWHQTGAPQCEDATFDYPPETGMVEHRAQLSTGAQ